MIIEVSVDITPEKEQRVKEKLRSIGYKFTPVQTGSHYYLVCIGKSDFDIRSIGELPGVVDVHRVSESYKLVSSKWKVQPSTVSVCNEVKIGNGNFALMAGPCSIESEEQVKKIISHLQTLNIRIMRGGVFKPRSSPYAFRGLGMEGLKMWYQHARAAGIRIITEVMQVSQVEEMLPYVDIFQVGARNSQNFNLLDALGQVRKPVLLKRALSGTIDELLHSAEYVFSKGNEQLLLCERGIRTYETAYRNTFDINAIRILKEKSHLPVIADPSHGVGLRDHVAHIALAAVVAGADGLIYEVHEKPEEALSDGQQTLNFRESHELCRKIDKINSVCAEMA